MIKSTILAALVALLAPNGARPQEVPDCSCSPRAFQFVISLGLDQLGLCENNDIVDNTGIQDATTACFIEAGNPPDPPVNGIIEEEIKDEGMIAEELTNPDYEVSNVTAFIFKEFDQSGDKISEISQNYGSTPLQNGDPINLFSVSSSLLSTSSSLEDQIGKVPYSVEIRLFGYNKEGQPISNIIRWSYNMKCGSDPIQTGNTIGWITIGELKGPWPQFCPSARPSSAPTPSPSISLSYPIFSKTGKTKTKAKAYNSKMGDRPSRY